MTTLQRYIFRQLLGPLGFFVLVLTSIVWLMQSLRIVDIVVNNGQGAGVFIEFTILLLPVVFSVVLQLGALAAVVFVMHRLMAESEMIAALSCGFSRLQIAKPVAIFGLGVTAMLAVDTLYLMPTAKQTMRARVAEVRGDLAAGLIRDGRFLNPTPGLTVYIREIGRDGEMRGVLVRDSRDESREIVTYTAQRGFLISGEEAPSLVLADGVAQRFDPTSDRLSILRFEELVYDLSFFADQGGERYRKPSERYVFELLDPPPEITNRRTIGRFIAEGHEQLSAPLYGFAFPLLAAAILLHAAFSRHGPGAAVAIALLACGGLRVMGLAFKSAVSGAPELWPLMYAPQTLAVAAALLLLTRTGLPRRARRAAAGRLQQAPGE